MNREELDRLLDAWGIRVAPTDLRSPRELRLLNSGILAGANMAIAAPEWLAAFSALADRAMGITEAEIAADRAEDRAFAAAHPLSVAAS